MSVIPESVKISLRQRLADHARRWCPELADITVRYRGQYAYVDGQLADSDVVTLLRLGYTGSEDTWDLSLYQASADTYEIGIFSSGEFDVSGPPERALDAACEIYICDLF